MMQELWDRLDPGFLAPVWLLVGFFAMIAVALLEFGAHRRRAQAVRMFAASHLASALTVSVSPFKRLLKAAILWSSPSASSLSPWRARIFSSTGRRRTAAASTSSSPSIAPKACSPRM